MLNLSFDRPLDEPLTVLCVGAHSDDLEIGCAGTILTLLDRPREIDVCWVVLSATDEREAEARSSAAGLLRGARSATIEVDRFRESYFPYVATDIKDRFERLAADVSPDVVLTHHRRDLHQDHRLVAELTWNTYRDHLILEYEVPKYDGDLGRPNLFVPLSPTIVERKIQSILDHFASQGDRSWFDEETFRALLRLRGLECNSPSRYAEAFHVPKLVLG